MRRISVRLGGLAAGVCLVQAEPALAQTSINTTSTSISETQQTVTRVETLPTLVSTRIDGVLVGAGAVGGVLVQDTLDSLAGRAGVASVGAAITAAGAPLRVRLGDPVVVGSRFAPGVLQDSSTALETLRNGPDLVTRVTTFGPSVLITGNRGRCATRGVSGPLDDPGEFPNGCEFPGTPVVVNQSVFGANSNTDTPLLVRTTVTDRVADVFEQDVLVEGTALAQFGTAHATTVRDAYRQADRVVRRALEERDAAEWLPLTSDPTSRWRFFVEGYGGFGRTGADPGRFVPPTRTQLGGGTAGLGFFGLPNVQLGLILDHGETRTDTRDSFAPERSTLRLTKAGPFGTFRIGEFSIGLVGVGGGGGSDTRNGSAAAGGVATADYGVRLVTGGVDLDYDLSRLTGFPLSPSIGVQWTRVETDRFTETGSPVALRGLGTETERTRSWIGLTYRDRVRLLGRQANLRLYGRYVRFAGDRDGQQDVVLAHAAGSDPLTVRGPRVGGSGGEWGGRLRLPIVPLVNASLSYDGTTDGAGSAHVFAFRARLAF